MYKSRKLSDVEQDAITLYKHFPNKTVQIIAKELKAPDWYISNILFKYLNGAVQDNRLFTVILSGNKKFPRKGLSPSPAALQIALQETLNSNLNLKTRKNSEN